MTPEPVRKDERSRSRKVSLSLGKEPRRSSPGTRPGTARPEQHRLSRPAPRLSGACSPSESIQVTSCPPDTGALPHSGALSSKAKYSPGAHPSVLQRAEAARFPQPVPRAIDQDF